MPVAFVVPGEHMAYFVECGSDKLAWAFFAHGANFDKWLGGVADLPAFVVGHAANVGHADAVNELGALKCDLVLGGEPQVFERKSWPEVTRGILGESNIIA